MTRSGINRALLALALLLAPAALAAPLYSKDEFKVDFSGYLMEQALDSRDFFGSNFTLAQTWLRPVLGFNFPKGVSAELSQTLILNSGSALDNPLYLLSQENPVPAYFKWDKRLADEDEFWLDWNIYRAWAQYEDERMVFTLGRQRIAFGSAFFYSPMDIFNPVSPLSLLPEERLGVDGANLELELGPSSRINLAYGIGDVIDESRFATYLKTTVGQADLHFLAARIYQDWTAGFGFAANLKDGSLYGEATYTWPETGHDYFRGTIGYQYSFPESVLLTAEYYHNEGVLSLAGLGQAAALFSQPDPLKTLDRNFLALSTSAELDPLLRLITALIYDLDAGSFYIGPSFAYSAPHSITFQAGAQLFGGSQKGDFGLIPNFHWAQLRWDF